MSREIDDLEAEIAETRADLDQALDLLQAKMTPSALINQAFDHVHRSPILSASMGPMYAHRPFTTMLLTAGLNWYLGKRAAKRAQEGDRAWQAHHDDSPRHRVRELTGRARTRVKNSAMRARERLTGAAHQVEDSAAHAMESAQGKASLARERLHTASDSAREKISAAKERGKQRMHDMMEHGRGRSHHMADSTRERMRSNKQRAKTFFEKQPMLAGAICAVIGAAIASAIPASETERRAARPLGSKMKRLKTQAKEKAVQGIERGATMATEALETATTKLENKIVPAGPSVH